MLESSRIAAAIWLTLGGCALVGCGGGSSPSPAAAGTTETTAASETKQSETTAPLETATAATTTSSRPAWTGFGARKEAFEGAHPTQNDAEASAGVEGAESVLEDHGRVDGFTLEFNAHPALSLEEAITRTRSELPRDARQIYEADKGACEQIGYESATLDRLFHGHGQVLVELQSESESALDRSAVTSATLSWLSEVSAIPC